MLKSKRITKNKMRKALTAEEFQEGLGVSKQVAEQLAVVDKEIKEAQKEKGGKYLTEEEERPFRERAETILEGTTACIKEVEPGVFHYFYTEEPRGNTPLTIEDLKERFRITSATESIFEEED